MVLKLVYSAQSNCYLARMMDGRLYFASLVQVLYYKCSCGRLPTVKIVKARKVLAIINGRFDGYHWSCTVIMTKTLKVSHLEPWEDLNLHKIMFL